ncbi:dihydrolipoyl dehydrogenase [Membranihabitans maritimus]|uniref:dihydrolipoyl dehydrogenase n=1 Tax=Membranihabitans maritimus TaxID=2904244 RepID=UPI001F010CD7|nr:dihydrolipoyl dehydrogenase [Membranihabitans maritimus]
MTYDVTVIGSGPGGYVAAIRAAQLGFNTLIIEKYATLGGTCLNVGCIPSKALLDSSEHFYAAKHKFEDFGISTGNLELDMARMIDRKDEVVKQTCDGIDFLMNKNKITVKHGHGTIEGKNKVKISYHDGKEETIETKYIIIATGSKPTTPAMFNYDKKRVITSTEALNIKEVPKSMLIVGGGVIGLELGSVFSRIGTEVKVVEFQDRIIPTMDKDCSKELMRALKKQGISFYLKHKVTDVQPNKKSATVTFEPVKGGEPIKDRYDYCLVAIGRRPYTDNLGLENVGIEVDNNGFIPVNEGLQTKLDNIYAIGDVIGGAMLAHKAEEEGILVTEKLAGQKPHINYNLIPGVVYTWPEVAAVGYTEEQLKEKGIEYKSGKFPFKALGRSRASGDTEGMIKVLAEKTTDEVLGIHMVGPRTADIIAEAVTAMEFRASAEDISRMSHAHPTYTEAVKEAALAATDNRPLHI